MKFYEKIFWMLANKGFYELCHLVKYNLVGYPSSKPIQIIHELFFQSKLILFIFFLRCCILQFITICITINDAHCHYINAMARVCYII